jgi:hypothetical protein
MLIIPSYWGYQLDGDLHTYTAPHHLARLWTYFFKTPMDLSKGNILCRNTGPRMKISSTRWTKRCVIILKKDGGNTNSKLTRYWATSFCNRGRSSGLITFWEIALRNAHSFTIGTRTFFGRMPLNATRSKCVISTWQSWDFRFWKKILCHIYYSLYIQWECIWDLDTVQAFKRISFSSLVRA